MEVNLWISAIHTVFEGELNPGLLHNSGRHSDCFVYYDCGEADYLFDGHTIHAREKSVFFIAKDSVYDIDVRKKSKYICIDFDFSPASKVRKSMLFSNISPTVCNEFFKFFHSWTQKSPWAIPQAYGILYRIYEEAIRSENKGYSRNNALFSKATEYIMEHYTDHTLSVSAIAQHANISVSHLRRLFQSNTNSSPINYIHLLRLEKAKNLLLTSNYSILEIASAVGYADPYYFSRLFKEKTGLSPLRYKQQKRS